MRMFFRRSMVLVALSVTAVVVLFQGSEPALANPLADVATGGSHTCAITLGTDVKCWGRNDHGQLGDDSNTNRTTPVDVSDLTNGVTAVAGGALHTCAVTVDGGVKCWGLNDHGQLGDGSTMESATPVGVSGLVSGGSAITAGAYHTCAIIAGGAKCWGLNDHGQLGNGTTTESPTPVDVTDLTINVLAISAGAYHTCAVTTAGAAKCWGWNPVGQLGNGMNTESPTPVNVLTLTSGVSTIDAGGDHTCAVIAGSAKCWGWNQYGQLGDGTSSDAAAPVSVSGLGSGVGTISVGSGHTCALTTGDTATCWGLNDNGQLGIGTNTGPETCTGFLTPCSKTPMDVSGLSGGVTVISLGGKHTCARISFGVVKCWGSDESGELGATTTELCDNAPVPCSTTPVDLLLDSDGDGCIDGREVQTLAGSELSGGRRNPKDQWDYFNPTGDRENRVDDVLAVVDAYFKDDNDATPGFPPFTPGYTQITDRTLDGPNLWNTGPPNGLQRVDDILNAIHQYFHDCG